MEKWNNHEDDLAEQTRRALLRKEADIELYKQTIADLTKQNYQLMGRIKELSTENRELMEADCCGAGSRAKVRENIKDKNDVPSLL
tara:strand:- start:5943 stop:6200 length:258 start_codon:yes stop_codon:yes gene_type:complete